MGKDTSFEDDRVLSYKMVKDIVEEVKGDSSVDGSDELDEFFSRLKAKRGCNFDDNFMYCNDCLIGYGEDRCYMKEHPDECKLEFR